MTPSFVTPDQIADVSGLTEKHVKRMISRAEGGGPYLNPLWLGVRMRVRRDDEGIAVAFASLPEHIRDAFVMQDQMELPLTSPGRN